MLGNLITKWTFNLFFFTTKDIVKGSAKWAQFNTGKPDEKICQRIRFCTYYNKFRKYAPLPLIGEKIKFHLKKRFKCSYFKKCYSIKFMVNILYTRK